jgi:hypothetical protein
MKKSSVSNLLISICGLGVVIGSLSSVIKVPIIFVVAIGFGIMLGGVFRAIGQIDRKLAKSEATCKTTE